MQTQTEILHTEVLHTEVLHTEVLCAYPYDPVLCRDAIERAGTLLKSGGLVAIPTETVYGLAANALDGNAVSKIFIAKGRPQDNPLIVHIAAYEQLQDLVAYVPESAKKLAKAFWPGPLTMILPKADCIPKEVSAGLSTVAVRFPSDPVAQAIIRAAGVPLAAPSANLSGKPSTTTFARTYEDMNTRADAIVDGGDCRVGVESTVITLVPDVPRVLRPGGITVEMLQSVLGQVEVDDAVAHELKKGAVAASPGMKYKHYAPKAEVYLLDGNREQFCAYVNAHKAPGVTAMCYTGEEALLSVPSLACGKEDDYAEQAKNLFEVLRRCDDELHAHTVYAHCPGKSGMGLAVFNRLIRSAAFRVVPVYPIVWGLTGPTGAGKSCVSAFLQENGCKIIDCDKVAHEVLKEPAVCAQLQAEFGDILDENGSVNRKKLAAAAFSSPQQTKRLNEITHPVILQRIRVLRDELRQQVLPGIVIDAPTLFEAGADTLCEQIITVTAAAEVRLQRIMARDGIEEAAAKLRMQAQKDEGFYTSRSDVVLHNDGDKKALFAQAQAVLQSAQNRRVTV